MHSTVWVLARVIVFLLNCPVDVRILINSMNSPVLVSVFRFCVIADFSLTRDTFRYL